eukprot:3381542-Alexandrium_andersonii.AAC.1
MAFTSASASLRSSSTRRPIGGAAPSTWPWSWVSRRTSSFGSPRSRGLRRRSTYGRCRFPPAGDALRGL